MISDKKKVARCSCILYVTPKLTQDTGSTQICQSNFKIRVYIQRQQFLLSYTSAGLILIYQGYFGVLGYCPVHRIQTSDMVQTKCVKILSMYIHLPTIIHISTVRSVCKIMFY